MGTEEMQLWLKKKKKLWRLGFLSKQKLYARDQSLGNSFTEKEKGYSLANLLIMYSNIPHRPDSIPDKEDFSAH